MKKPPQPTHHLELRVHALEQLFNSLDPTPFLNKDLDREAEAFIESWALEFSSNDHLHITIHVEQPVSEGDATQLMTEAIHNYFTYKTGRVIGELKRLLKEGRFSLVVGLAFVTLCLFGAEIIGQAIAGTAFSVVREGLTIIGWVALWRPMQIFLYDWWPLVRRIRIYKNLVHAHIRVQSSR